MPELVPNTDLTRAVYAGSFDPITNGHENVIIQGASLFSELHVLVAANPNKTPLFTPDERVDMIGRVAIANGLANVSAGVLEPTELVADFARDNGYTHLLRGLRDTNDLIGEFPMAAKNALIGKIETTFVRCPIELSYISSSFVKGFLFHRDWETHIRDDVPPAVLAMIRNKMAAAAKA